MTVVSAQTLAAVLGALPQEIKGWLGRGIDLFQCEPFEPPSTKPARLLSSSLPQDFRQIESVNATNYNEIYADSFLEMTHKLTVEAGLKGSYGGAGGSVESKFGFSENRIEKRHLLQIYFIGAAANYGITGNEDVLRRYLDDDFKNALQNWDANELFDVYGTHLIIKMIVGGKAEYYCQSSDLSSISQKDFRAAAMAKYESAGGSLEGCVGVAGIDSTKQQLVSGSLNIITRGGSLDAANKIRDGAWSLWVNSIESKPGFLGFDQANGLKPIWKLAAEPARRTAIHEAYKRKAAKALRMTIISDTSAKLEPHPKAYVKVPDGYKLLSGGARVNYQGKGNFLTASFPDGNNVWRARAKDHIESDPATITVYAVAIYDPDDIWEVKLFSSQPSATGYTIKADAAVDSGYVMVGGGAKVDYGAGGGNLLYKSIPFQGKWVGESKDIRTESAASITAYAVGLRPKVPGIKVEAQIKISPRSSYATSVVEDGSPESPYVMSGGGAHAIDDRESFQPRQSGLATDVVADVIKKGLMRSMGLGLTGSYPKDISTWQGRGKDTPSHPTQGYIEVYAIGVKVGDA